MPNQSINYDSFTKKYLTVFLLSLICVGYIFGSFLLARKFPPVNSDEVVRAVIGTERMQGRPPRYTLYDDIFASSHYSLRDVLPDLSISIYHYWLGAWTSLNPKEFLSSRASSIIPGFFTLLLFYALGTRLGGSKMGLWSVLICAATPFFLTASTVARPEMLLLLCSTALVLFVIGVPERITLKPFYIGLFGCVQMGIHPNAALICIGIYTLYLLSIPKQERIKGILLLMSGSFAGLLSVLLMTDLKRLWLGMHTIHSYLLRPPLLSWPWRP